MIGSACKHVVGERFKQTVMRWEKPGINAVIKWRSLSKNKAWDNIGIQTQKQQDVNAKTLHTQPATIV